MSVPERQIVVLCLIGTRPEAIKMASVIRELKARPQARVVVCATGQHREMIAPILSFFEIEPEIDLDLMKPDQTLVALTSRLLEGIDDAISQVSPDWVVAQGDTTSVMAGALAAFYRKVPFAHVEAGLRTGSLDAPFPEEFHRRVADMVASLHFAPTAQAVETLRRENVPEERILLTGNTVVDALVETAKHDPEWSAGPLENLDRDAPIVMITAHRRENFGRPLREICEAVADLARHYADRHFQWVFPVHLNPNVRCTVREILADVPGVKLMEPLDYFWNVQLMKRCRLILTDSGGIQEEAPSLGVPVLVLRTTTERREGVELGTARLIGWSRETIIQETIRVIRETDGRTKPTIPEPNPYGDGFAGKRIADALIGRIPAKLPVLTD
ncbi:UDP-N-acetylglucosamine 2-epimerase (non-hydrolyzing) [bacterium]|nr:UDP-N-acetylglucosamine 2-epimerase (non-hydrolyzing) [bacterium]